MSRLSSEQEDLHEALIDLYLSVKIRSNDEVNFQFLIARSILTTSKHYPRKGKSSGTLITSPYLTM